MKKIDDRIKDVAQATIFVPNLNPEMVGVDQILPYAKNAKKHNRSQIDKLKKKIIEIGFRWPIMLKSKNEHVIVVGHGRMLAAQELGMKSLPCIFADGMSDAQIKAFRIADNRLAESGWDDLLLKDDFLELKNEGYDLSLTGFDESEINKLLPQELAEDDVIDVSAYERAKANTKVQLGDIYQLGAYIILDGKRVDVEVLK